MKRINRSRVFLAWLLSYIFILAMPIMVVSVVYSKAKQTIDAEVVAVNQSMLNRLQSMLDGVFSSFSRIAGDFSINSDVRALLSFKGEDSRKVMRTMLRTQDNLSRYLLTDSFIEEIFIYANNGGYVLSSGYKYNPSDLPGVCSRLGFEDSSVFLQLEKERPCVRFLTAVMERGTRKSICYACPLYAYNYREPAGLLMIQLRNEAFDRLIDSAQMANQTDIVLLNSLGESYGLDGEMLPSYSELREYDEHFQYNVRQEQKTVSHITSDVLDCQIVSLISTDLFWKESSDVQQVMLFYTGLCVLAGVCVAVFFAKRNYHPLENMKSLLEKNQYMIHEESNEYKMLEHALLDLLDKESTLRTFAHDKEEIQRNNLLTQLLQGHILFDSQYAEEFAANQITFIQPYFTAVTIVIRDDKDATFRKRMIQKEEYDLFVRAVREVGETVFSDHYAVSMADISGSFSFILNYDDELLLSSIQPDTQKIIRFIQRSLNVEMYANIGNAHTGRTAISDAYSDTLLIQSYRDFYENVSPIILMDDINNGIFSIQNKQHRFSSCITSGDYPNARRILETEMQMLASSMLSVELTKAEMIGYASFLMNRLLTEGADMDKAKTTECVACFEQLAGSKSVKVLMHFMLELFDSVTACLKQGEQKMIPEYIQKAEKYVQEHYTDPELSVSGIAEALTLSSSYLSRTFKKYKNVGLLDYIHLCRLEKAKQFVQTMSVSAVAQKVGYYDSKALISVFKRYEGTTPGKFREENGTHSE